MDKFTDGGYLIHLHTISGKLDHFIIVNNFFLAPKRTSFKKWINLLKIYS
jgi:hypothetical protein